MSSSIRRNVYILNECYHVHLWWTALLSNILSLNLQQLSISGSICFLPIIVFVIVRILVFFVYKITNVFPATETITKCTSIISLIICKCKLVVAKLFTLYRNHMFLFSLNFHHTEKKIEGLLYPVTHFSTIFFNF